jgi:GNAT superfamily N-acetyltransferase
MASHAPPPGVTISPFTWPDWTALWTIRYTQLAEYGLHLDLASIPDRPQPNTEDVYEWDFHNLDRVYLHAAGNFWIARADEQPVGYVGGQDIGGAIELRRMYVDAAYRRRGIGAALARALIEHSRGHAARAIELWTAPDGPGRQLYRSLGFRVITTPGMEFADVQHLTRYRPDEDEIRMRLELIERSNTHWMLTP